MKVLDLFSGIGGFSLGLERAGMETIAFCEIDEHCRRVLKKHWPKIPIFEDVKTLIIMPDDTKVDGTDHIKEKEIDVICGGYPCVGHSAAGQKDGFKNVKSKLWEEYHRLVREIKPKYCILENSPNLRGTGLVELLKAFNEIGYNAEWQIVSAYFIGSPHQRERLYCVFWRKDLPYCDPFRSFRPDFEKAKGSSWWWSMRRFTRDSLFRKIPSFKPKVLKFNDGISEGMDLSQVEEEIKQMGNAVLPQIPYLIGKRLMDFERGME